jgi:hypothetical protein
MDIPITHLASAITKCPKRIIDVHNPKTKRKERSCYIDQILVATPISLCSRYINFSSLTDLLPRFAFN